MKVFITLTILLSGCYVPNYLPEINKYQNSQYGCFLTIKLTDKTKIRGELLAIENDVLYILNDDIHHRQGVLSINSSNMDSWKVQIHQPKLNPLIIPALSITTISHGIGLVVSLPLNIIVSSTLYKKSVYQGSHKTYRIKDLQSLSRYPQGIPTGLDVFSLKPNY